MVTTATLSLDEARRIAFGGNGTFNDQRAFVNRIISPTISGQFHTSSEKMLQLFGIEASVAEPGSKNYSKAAYANNKLENAVMRVGAFAKVISNESDEKIIEMVKAGGGEGPHPDLTAEQRSQWLTQAKQDLKNNYLDQVAGECESFTKSQVGTGGKSAWAIAGGLLFAGMALKRKVTDPEGKLKTSFGLGTILRLGFFGLIGFHVSKFFGEITGGIVGGIASRFGKTGEGIISSMLGEKTVASATDVLSGRAKNRAKLREGLQRAMENTVGVDMEIIMAKPTGTKGTTTSTPAATTTDPVVDQTQPVTAATNDPNFTQHQTPKVMVADAETRLTTHSEIDGKSPQVQYEYQLSALLCFQKNYGPHNTKDGPEAIAARIEELKAEAASKGIKLQAPLPEMTSADFNKMSMHDADSIMGTSTALHDAMMARATAKAHARLNAARQAKQAKAAGVNVNTSQILNDGGTTFDKDRALYEALLKGMPSIDALVELAADHPKTRVDVLNEITQRQSKGTTLPSTDTLTAEEAIEAIKAMPEGKKAEYTRPEPTHTNDNITAPNPYTSIVKEMCEGPAI